MQQTVNWVTMQVGDRTDRIFEEVKLDKVRELRKQYAMIKNEINRRLGKPERVIFEGEIFNI